MRSLLPFLLLACVACAGSPRTRATSYAGARGTQGEFSRVLERVGDTLGPARSFRFEAELSMDRPVWGDAEQGFVGTLTVEVRRPDRFRLTFLGEGEHKSIEHDGRSLALVDHSAGTFARFPVGVGIRRTLERCDELGLRIPFAALLHPDPRLALVSHAQQGRYVGIERGEAQVSHRVAFGLDGRAWTMTIREHEGTFLPEAIEVHVGEDLRSRGALSGWDLAADLPLDHFSLRPPPGARQVPLATLLE